jgi:ParE toxin of type II toxin-antitoxin system, parDE
MSRFRVRLTQEAEEDLLRLFDFLIEEDISAADRARASIAKAFEVLECSRFRAAKPSADREIRFYVSSSFPLAGPDTWRCSKSKIRTASPSLRCAINGKTITTEPPPDPNPAPHRTLARERFAVESGVLRKIIWHCERTLMPEAAISLERVKGIEPSS